MADSLGLVALSLFVTAAGNQKLEQESRQLVSVRARREVYACEGVGYQLPIQKDRHGHVPHAALGGSRSRRNAPRRQRLDSTNNKVYSPAIIDCRVCARRSGSLYLRSEQGHPGKTGKSFVGTGVFLVLGGWYVLVSCVYLFRYDYNRWWGLSRDGRLPLVLGLLLQQV